jgi:hypothetical protein
MKIKIILLLMLIMMFLGNLFSDEQQTTLGIKVMAGGRYDDMRMCVGSAADVKGGPIADVMLLIKKEY